MLKSLRALLPALVLLLLLGGFAAFLHTHYPLQHWLFFRYAGYVLCVGVCLASMWVLGDALVRRALRVRLPLLEQLAVSFGVGLFGFQLAMFLGGVLRFYGAVWFFLLPVALLSGLGPGAFGYARRAFRLMRGARRRRKQRSLFESAVILFGCLGLLMIYFLILTPENVQFDSHWKHLALAERYAVSGGIGRVPEGSIFSVRPHSASFLYAWAFLLPWGELFDHMVLSAHLEFGIFVVTTLVGIPAMVRRMVPRADPSLVWVARFLFPGVLLYDSSLSAGADHIGAAFAPALFLLLVRVLTEFELKKCLLLGAVMAAATLVKETTALVLIPGVVLATLLRLAWLTLSRVLPKRRTVQPPLRNAWLGACVAAASALLFTTPYWLSNWVWHGAPLYPMLANYFSPRPFNPEVAEAITQWSELEMWRPDYDLEGLWESLKALFLFSFVPHDWENFHGDVPVFGSLFTLLLFILPFLKGTRRIWFLVGWIHFGVFCWFWVHHQDRYLQGLMPWMAAVTAAVLVLMMRQLGRLTRVLAGGLVLLQVVWGGDVYFIQTHSMVRSPLKRVIDLLEGGYRKRYEERFRTQTERVAIARALPDNAVLLRHEIKLHLGVGVPTVDDTTWYQFGLDYDRVKNHRALYRLFRQMGVTHFWWEPRTRGQQTLSSDLVFFDFIYNHARDPKRIGRTYLAAMPEKPPSDDYLSNRGVLVIGCKRPLRDGLYRLRDLRIRSLREERARPRKRVQGSVDQSLLDEAYYVLHDPRCKSKIPSQMQDSFQRAAIRTASRRQGFPGYEIWIRKGGKDTGVAGK